MPRCSDRAAWRGEEGSWHLLWWRDVLHMLRVRRIHTSHQLNASLWSALGVAGPQRPACAVPQGALAPTLLPPSWQQCARSPLRCACKTRPECSTDKQRKFKCWGEAYRPEHAFMALWGANIPCARSPSHCAKKPPIWAAKSISLVNFRQYLYFCNPVNHVTVTDCVWQPAAAGRAFIESLRHAQRAL